MTYSSFPAYGNGGFTISEWASYFDERDGAADSYATSDLSLSRSDAGSVLTLGTGRVDVNGYAFVISAAETLTCPTPSSGSATYYVIVYYDPTLNVADSSDNASPLGPCRLAIYASSDVTAAMSGKAYVLLYGITRAAGQALSSATVVSYVRWIGGPSVEWPTTMTLPVSTGAMPRGTLRGAPDSNQLMQMSDAGSGALGWVDLLNDGPWALPLGAAFIARTGKTTVPQYYQFGRMIGMAGQIQRTSGNLSTGSTVTLGTVPAGRRPGYSVSFICKCGGTNNYAQVQINSDSTTDGAILMIDPPSSTTWLDLSAVQYRIGA